MPKKYLVAIREGDIFQFDKKKNRDAFIKVLKAKKNIEYATAESEE